MTLSSLRPWKVYVFPNSSNEYGSIYQAHSQVPGTAETMSCQKEFFLDVFTRLNHTAQFCGAHLANASASLPHAPLRSVDTKVFAGHASVRGVFELRCCRPRSCGAVHVLAGRGVYLPTGKPWGCSEEAQELGVQIVRPASRALSALVLAPSLVPKITAYESGPSGMSADARAANSA